MEHDPYGFSSRVGLVYPHLISIALQAAAAFAISVFIRINVWTDIARSSRENALAKEEDSDHRISDGENIGRRFSMASSCVLLYGGAVIVLPSVSRRQQS